MLEVAAGIMSFGDWDLEKSEDWNPCSEMLP